MAHTESGSIDVIASNRHKLSIYEVPGDLSTSLFLHPDGCKALAKMLSPDQKVTLHTSENHTVAIFSTERDTIAIRTMDSSFPNYRNLIPSDFDAYLTMKTKELEAVLKRATSVGDKSTLLTLKMDSEGIHFFAQEEDGEFFEKIEDTYLGPEFEASFLAENLLGYLRLIKSEEVRLKFKNHLLLVVPQDSEEPYTLVIATANRGE